VSRHDQDLICDRMRIWINIRYQDKILLLMRFHLEFHASVMVFDPNHYGIMKTDSEKETPFSSRFGEKSGSLKVTDDIISD